jgi:hypothetical protein
MLYIKVDGLTVLKYPYTFSDLRADNPNTSFPDSPSKENFTDFGASVVIETQKPEATPTHFVIEDTPKRIEGQWLQQWNLVPHSQEYLREQWKAQRAAMVEAIKVTTQSGNEFDGDEISQGRMARAVSSMEDTDTVIWVLANNTPIMATRAELKEALKMAGSAQAAIWVAP